MSTALYAELVFCGARGVVVLSYPHYIWPLREALGEDLHPSPAAIVVVGAARQVSDVALSKTSSVVSQKLCLMVFGFKLKEVQGRWHHGKSHRRAGILGYGSEL